MKKRLFALSLLLLALLLAACGGAAPAPVEDAAAPAADTAVDVDIATGPIRAPEGGPAPRGAAATTADVAGVCLSPQEAELAQRINEYRASVGLPAIPVSKSLTLVAQQHAWDSNTNGQPGGPECNMHSWTGNVNPALTEGTWTEVCYTDDHANAAGVWRKPREIAGFQADGYENSYRSGGNATPAGALNGWKNSPGHNALITETGIWDKPFLALGVGINGGYAHMWVAEAADPAGVATVCGGGEAAPAPTAVPPTAAPAEPTAVPAEPTAVPAEPTAVPVEPTAVPAEPTAAPAEPTAVPAEPTAAPPPATGEILNEAGTVAAGETREHTFPVADGGSYTINVLPAPDFDAEPAYSCTTDGGSRSGSFDLGFEGENESTSFPINGNGTCTLTVTGYGGTGGSYTVVVTSP